MRSKFTVQDDRRGAQSRRIRPGRTEPHRDRMEFPHERGESLDL
jgi:hypothetical protein